jgi:hypothetical protein
MKPLTNGRPAAQERVHPDRADLSLADAKAAWRRRYTAASRGLAPPSRLVNVEVPAELFDAIDHIADEMVGTRTAAVLALLNGVDCVQRASR